ncbi:MAG: tetratricopeptide repeat protein [Verrucomicrobiota bacterium]
MQTLQGRNWFFGLLLVGASFLAYLPALRGQFIWDDDAWTTNIAGLLRDVSGLCMIWSHPAALQQYYPLTGTTFWLDYHFWGFWPLPYHVENILLHALAAVLFWRLLRRLQLPGAWLAAAIFALHPVMVESVAWITERKNVLSLVFYLGALLAYLRYAPQVTSGKWQVTGTEAAATVRDPPPATRHASLFYGLAFLLFLGALLAKATAFSLPAVILLVCWWKRGCIRWRADVLPVLPFFALAIGLCLVTAWLEKNHVGAKGAEWAISWPGRCLIAGRAPWFYLGKLLWPANLCFIYPRWRPDAASLAQWIYPITALGALVALWLARTRLGRGPVAAALFFAGTLFPVLGFMNAYGMRYSFVWDHWVYLPSLGLIALVAALVARVAERLRQPVVLLGFAALVLPVFAMLTWRQCGMYANLETLWRTTIAKNPNAFLAYHNLGVLLSEKGDKDAAVSYIKKSLEINPDIFEAHNHLGLILLSRGQLDQAMDQFKQALEINPNFVMARNNLGVALMRSGRMDEAVMQYQQAVKLAPDYAEAYYNWGLALGFQGKSDEAMAQYQKAIDLKPDYAEAHYDLGVALGLRGRLNEAVEQYQKAIAIRPDYADAHGNLANVLAAQGRLEEAIPEYWRTLELVPNSGQAHFRFGQALQTLHNFTAAKTEYQKVLELDPKHLPAHLSLAWLLATSPEASLRNGNRAVELTQQAEQLAGGESPQLLDTLAAAYAEAGRYPEAVEAARRALNLPATQNNQPLAEAIQARLKLYETGSPYHEKP